MEFGKYIIYITGTQNGDLPADTPLGPAGLSEHPAKANTDQDLTPLCYTRSDYHQTTSCRSPARINRSRRPAPTKADPYLNSSGLDHKPLAHPDLNTSSVQIGASSSERHARRLLYHQLRSPMPNQIRAPVEPALRLNRSRSTSVPMHLSAHIKSDTNSRTYQHTVSSNLVRTAYHQPASNMVFAKRCRIDFTQPASTLVTQNGVALPPDLDNQLTQIWNPRTDLHQNTNRTGPRSATISHARGISLQLRAQVLKSARIQS
ncbi:hypothetical protein F511_39549 [Dorcoceras hygrometricum]|uniref:Uncharacterized protein n=1 Tax=Dorcoceras hygrometricum TaxID=472368 RepID=A0A2Z7A5W0_9LAMI|nr:hypothetical protein F511_39549 [Dorcoceras hygrometricum]